MTAFRSRWDDWTPKVPTPRTDKTDRRAFVSSVSSSPRPFPNEIGHTGPEIGVSPSNEGSQKAPTSLTDKTDKSIPQGFKLTTDTADRSLLHRAHLAVVPDLSDPEDIQTWFYERGGMREDSGAERVDADRAAFNELLWIWHAANPIELAPGQCAACGTTFVPPVMSLPDGATVCDRPDHGCLIGYGNGRRTAAVNALHTLGIGPPAWWKL